MFEDLFMAIDDFCYKVSSDILDAKASKLLAEVRAESRACEINNKEKSSEITDKANFETTAELSTRKRIKEIDGMRELLDIMKKQVIGELSQEDVRKIQKFASRWKKDIYNLSKSVDKLDFTELNKIKKDWSGDLHRGNNERESSMKDDCLEIENMRRLLNIMKRHLCGNLTPQDIVDLEENTQKWDKDIKKLSKLLAN